MTPRNKLREKLISAYENLSPFEQAVVQLLSVAYETITETCLVKCFRSARPAFPDAELTAANVGSYLGKLEELGLVGADLRCSEAIVEVVTRRAVASGNYDWMVEAVRREAPAVVHHYPNLGKYCLRLMRDLRMAMYSHQEEAFSKTYELLYSRCSAYTEPGFFVRTCNNPFDPEWFCTLPFGLQSYALAHIFYNTSWSLDHDGAPLAYALSRDFLSSLPADHKNYFFYQVICRLLIGGQLSQAARLIPSIAEGVFTGGLQGWALFLQGKNDEAIELFEADLKEIRRRTGRKKGFFNGMPGLFYVLALMKRQDTSLQGTINELAGIIRTKFSAGSHLSVPYDALRAIIHVQNFEPEKAREILLRQNQALDGVSFFFSSLATFWVEGHLGQKRIDALSEMFIKARDIGLSWLAMECAELLCRVEQPTPIRQNYVAKVRSETGMQSIVSIFQLEEPWRKSLRALIKATESRQPASTAAAPSDIRLAWFIDYHDGSVSLQPKEQKMTARGGWSKGRPVALKRLYSGKSPDYLTQQDHLICSAIERRSYYAYYGAEYHLDIKKALPALVGHPLVFLESAPTVPVELVKGEPEVIVTQSGTDIRIRLSPQISDQSAVIERETPTRFKLIEPSEDHRRIARILGDKGLVVPASAREEVLPAIASISTLVTVHSAIGGISKDIVEKPSDPTPHVHLMPAGSGFRLEMFVRPFADGGPYLKPGQGAEIVMAEIDGKRMQTRRDLKLEESGARMVEICCPTLADSTEIDRQWLLDRPEDCLQVLLDLKGLQEKGEVVVEWPEGEKLKVTRQVTFDQLRMKIRGGTDWFEVSGQLEVDDSRVVDMKQLLDLIHTSSSRFIPLGDGQFVALTKELRKRLEDLEAYSERRGKSVTLHPLAALAMGEFTNGILNLDVDETWKRRLDRIREGFELAFEVPSTLKVELRDYQVEGYRWLARLAHLGFGGCLADDMGLGKTVQALALMLDKAPQGPSLVVAPTSVCMNWMTEIDRFAPTLNAVTFGGNNRQQMVRGLKGHDVLVASYGLLHQESELLASVEWNVMVLDEAQAIKNVLTKRSQAAMGLKGAFKLITTGTPIENHLGELWNLFNFINPGLLGSHTRFNERFAVPIQKYQDREARKRLKKLIQPFVLRRMKSQVLEELPPRTEVTLQVEMSREEAAFYEALRQRALESLEKDNTPIAQKHIVILAEITKLRQAACNPKLVMPESGIESSKLDLFGEVVEELLENRHKALVFSQFVGHLALIRKYLDRKKIRYRYLDGSTPPRERKKEVDAFQAGDGDLFLISLKAGGLGLNLTAADYVIIMDPWWNPAVEDQASDRAHRIGQQRPVTVYRLVAGHTIEEKIVKLHREKRDLASSLLEGSDISGKISAEDLLKLIREPA